MDEHLKSVAKACLEGAEGNSITFPEIVGTLTQAGFESYMIDFRRASAIYYLPCGDSIEFEARKTATPVAPMFDTASLQAAINEAQRLVPGYTYKGFCEKAVSAGCAGYMVSFPGRRVLYFGRTAEIHTEHFPQ